MKKIFWGLVILIFGIIWYLRDSGAIALEPFWPWVVIVAGLIILAKAFFYKPRIGKRKR